MRTEDTWKQVANYHDTLGWLNHDPRQINNSGDHLRPPCPAAKNRGACHSMKLTHHQGRLWVMGMYTELAEGGVTKNKTFSNRVKVSSVCWGLCALNQVLTPRAAESFSLLQRHSLLCSGQSPCKCQGTLGVRDVSTQQVQMSDEDWIMNATS